MRKALHRSRRAATAMPVATLLALAFAAGVAATPAPAPASGPPAATAPAVDIARSADTARYGPRLEGFAYPWPPQSFDFNSQGQPLSMAYLDVAPTVPANGQVVVLLHGKNFCAATWEDTIRALTGAGYRVIAPDQVGFCKSSKPSGYQFTFAQLAGNTRALLDTLGIEKPIVIGHSMGGMLAARYALQYPQGLSQLVLVNPIGLEDWAAAGVPWRSVDAWNARELKTSFDSVKQYQQAVYYDGKWQPRYDRWVSMLAGMYAGPGKAIVAMSQAQASDMIATQPVVYELPRIAVPTTLFIGQTDRTAIGKDLAPPDVQAKLGNYPLLGRAAARAIPGATLVEFADLGHSPQVEDPARFNAALLEAIRARHPARPQR